MCKFQNENMCTISYEDVRKAMGDEPYTMQLVDPEEDAGEVEKAVNIGIDSHLEACYAKERGDSYEWETRPVSEKCVNTKLHCAVSKESLPVLLRRLFENDPCSGIGSSILMTLGFNEGGEQVGREALGLD